MILGTVSAVERTAPVHGEQPSDRIRHMTRSSRSPGSIGHERLLVDNQRVPADDDVALLREVERNHGNLLDVDVVPHVELGPVRQRKHANALARTDAAVQEVPELRPLTLRDPTVPSRRAAKTRAPLARDRSSSRRAPAERGLELPGFERVEERLGLEQTATSLCADGKGLRAVGKRLGVGVDDQFRANQSGVVVAELDHLAELVGRVDVEQRKRDATWIERLLRETKQHRGVLADRVQHHRPLELGDDLPDDVDALGFERAQVIQAKRLAARADDGGPAAGTMASLSSR